MAFDMKTVGSPRVGHNGESDVYEARIAQVEIADAIPSRFPPVTLSQP